MLRGSKNFVKRSLFFEKNQVGLYWIFLEDPMKRVLPLALALLPLTLVIACEKKAADPAPAVNEEVKEAEATPAEGAAEAAPAEGAEAKPEEAK
jgi:hypothetical protein